jgi:hypothetical protein
MNDRAETSAEAMVAGVTFEDGEAGGARVRGGSER